MKLYNEIIGVRRAITFLLIVLVISLQFYPRQSTNSVLSQKSVESSIYEYVFIITPNAGINQGNESRQNLEVKSSAQYCYDKNDITQTVNTTNYKKINFGRLSTLKRYSSFLTAQFSTST